MVVYLFYKNPKCHSNDAQNNAMIIIIREIIIEVIVGVGRIIMIAMLTIMAI